MLICSDGSNKRRTEKMNHAPDQYHLAKCYRGNKLMQAHEQTQNH